MKEKNVIKYIKDRAITEYNAEEDLGDKYFEALGGLLFYYTKDGLQYRKQSVAENIPNYVHVDEKEEYIKTQKEWYFQKLISDMFDGLSFLENVECGGFIDYDGSISAIYVDGHLSNLGLAHKGICQGEFLVNGEAFKEMCESHHVLVDWANK